MRKYEVKINKKTYVATVKSFTPETAIMEINGKDYVIKLDGEIQSMPTATMAQSVPAPSPPVAAAPQVAPQPVPSSEVPTSPPAPSSAGSESVVAPIPGSIMEVFVKVGESVETGQLLLKMEAMKMENEINASCGGTIKSINVASGDAVNQGQSMIEIQTA